MQPPDRDAIAAALRSRAVRDLPALPGRRNHLRAGVLLPLRRDLNALDCAAILRPPRAPEHGGEVSFPGGGPKPEDGGSILNTALREAREELGLSEVDVLGRLDSTPLYTSEWRLEPYVGWLTPPVELMPCPLEVERPLWFDLMTPLRSGEVEAVRIDAAGRRFTMPVFRADGFVVYGATSIVMMELVRLLADVTGVAQPEMVPGALDFEDLMGRGARAGRTT